MVLGIYFPNKHYIFTYQFSSKKYIWLVTKKCLDRMTFYIKKE